MPSLYGAGVLALVVRHANCAFQERSGYVVQQPGEGDIPALPAEVIDLQLAQQKCDRDSECKAISFSRSTGKAYYKSSASPVYNDCWKSFSKQNGFQPVDGFLPAGDDLSEATSLSDAQRTCSGSGTCAGYSQREGDDNKVYLKKKWSAPHHDCWSTYEKTAGVPTESDEPVESDEPPAYYGGGQAEESAAAYYGAPAAEESSAAYYGAPAAEESAAAYYGAAESSAPTYYG